jgi:hypothetical protein
MPLDNRVDQSKQSQGTLGTAPYMAKIVNHLDPTFQGGVEVSLIRPSGNQIADENQTYNVKYSSPFYGTTAFEFTGNNVTYEDAQKSYGFWGVPPDIGVTGIVIFIDGQPDKGFWLCCVQDVFQNHMIPAIGGTKNYTADKDYEQAEHPLPVVEHNRRANEMSKGLEIDKVPRAVHPFADRIKEQGLVRDEFRGTSGSTVRRDLPNLVFGMSSPGPLDRAGKKSFVGNRQSLSGSPVPISRLGGTQFVMDDGDDRYFRSKKAAEGPPEYIKDGGNFDLPYNEHFRIRTRTGHQILLHNTEDLIYIGNARGTAWIEITSDGKIDIFATDSISFRTKQDFNFYADRDLNIEVGRNINIKAAKETQIETGVDYNLIIGNNGKITLGNNLDTNAGGHIWETSGGSNETLAGANIIETASPDIHMNGPTAATAEKAKPLKTHKLPDITKQSAKDAPVDLVTILRRAPTPEAYPHHENLDPISFKPDKLDRDSQGRYEGESSDLRTPPTDWKKYKKPGDNPF